MEKKNKKFLTCGGTSFERKGLKGSKFPLVVNLLNTLGVILGLV